MSDLLDVGVGVVRRAARWLFCRRRARIYVLSGAEFEQRQLDDVQTPDCHEFRQVESGQIDRVAHEMGFRAREMKRRYDAGSICFVVHDNDQCSGFSWVHTGEAFVRGIGYSFSGSDIKAYVYGVYTYPEHRGKGTYSFAQRKLIGELWRRGVRAIYQLVELGNTPVEKTLPKLGYVCVQSIRMLRLFGIRFVRVADVTNGHSKSRVVTAIPTGIFCI